MDFSEGCTIVGYDDNDGKMFLMRFDSIEELLAFCEKEEVDPAYCYIFDGKLNFMGIDYKLSVVEVNEEEEEEEEDC